MDNSYLKELLYNTEKSTLISQLSMADDPLILHFFAANYNWNSGFDVPTAILENEVCDLGTGLLMFHNLTSRSSYGLLLHWRSVVALGLFSMFLTNKLTFYRLSNTSKLSERVEEKSSTQILE